MPVPSSSPYKSRLLTFLNRQSLRLKTRIGYRWRQVKNAAEWGIQILLYPIYLLLQTVRQAGHQLKQFFRTRPLLHPTARNEPLLQHLFKVVENELLPLEVNSQLSGSSESVLIANTPTLLNKPLTIQGIATLLNDRRLILVSSDNQSLDILSSEQQQQLQDCIYREIANYWYERRLQASLMRKIPGLMPSFKKTKENVLPPIRWFWKIMRWEQTGQVAVTINLFGESTLVRYNPPALTPTLADLTLLKTSQKQAGNASPLPEIQNLSLVSQTLSDTLKTIGQGTVQALNARLQKWLASPLASTDRDPFEIQAIIRAAVDYYFSQDRGRIFLQTSRKQSISQLSGRSWSETSLVPSGSFPRLEDPWLVWEDLFTDSDSPQPPTNPPTPSPPALARLPIATQTPVTPKKSVPKIEVPRSRQKPPSPQSAIVPRREPPKTPKQPVSQIAAEPSLVQTPKPAPSKTYVDPSSEWPDWIETEATPTGYVKHPLERILEWLDTIILWVEELIIAVWNWIETSKQRRKRTKAKNRRK